MCELDARGAVTDIRDDQQADAPRFWRCLACGGPLDSSESQRLGAGEACRNRLGEDELARRRAAALASRRRQLWTRPAS
jgi:hypothetical protein